MSKDFYKIPCVFLIVVLVLIISYATFVKFTYEKPNNVIQNNSNSISEKNETEVKQPSTKSKMLSCKKNYIDDTTKSTIDEIIDVIFIENETSNQNIIKTYKFQNKEDYDSFIASISTKDITADETNLVVEIKEYSDYTTPYNSNNIMDFRDMDYDELKNALEKNNYKCS